MCLGFSNFSPFTLFAWPSSTLPDSTNSVYLFACTAYLFLRFSCPSCPQAHTVSSLLVACWPCLSSSPFLLALPLPRAFSPARCCILRSLRSCLGSTPMPKARTMLWASLCMSTWTSACPLCRQFPSAVASKLSVFKVRCSPGNHAPQFSQRRHLRYTSCHLPPLEYGKPKSERT